MFNKNVPQIKTRKQVTIYNNSQFLFIYFNFLARSSPEKKQLGYPNLSTGPERSQYLISILSGMTAGAEIGWPWRMKWNLKLTMSTSRF